MQVTDSLPTGLVFVRATGGATAAGGVVTLNAGALAVGASASFEVVAKPTSHGALTNSAMVTSSVADGNLSNNVAQTVVTSVLPPVVTIAAVGKGEAVRGGVSGKLLVHRAGELTTALTVFYEEGGSAAVGVDYKRPSGQVTLPAGVAQAKITITPTANKHVDGDFTAIIRLIPSKTGSYKVGAEARAKIKIIDGD